MTEPKKVAKSLKTILEEPEMISIMDRSCDISKTIDEVFSWWKYDLYSRKPGKVLDENGDFSHTNLDLACVLFELANRNAVINLPEYKRIRPKSIKENQYVISDKNRHGQILNIFANKETFLFSIKIKDMNVVSNDQIGYYRNFSITNLSGNWYDGWKKIEFLPNAKENSFLNESDILKDNSIIFHDFSHPNRWTSLFGKYYFITKCLMNRLSEESYYYNTAIKNLLERGIKFPEVKDEEETKYDDNENSIRESGKSIKVKAFQVEVDIPDNESIYPEYEDNSETLKRLYDLRKKYIYKIIPKLRFATRATELSYFNKLKNKSDNELLPGWLDNVKWERDFSLPKKRIKWDRLVLFQPEVGKLGVSIRKREYEKSEVVDNDYEER